MVDSEFLDAYELLELVGQGSFSRVYKVRLKDSPELETEVARFDGQRAQAEKEFAAKQIRKGSKSEWGAIDEVRCFVAIFPFLLSFSEKIFLLPFLWY